MLRSPCQHSRLSLCLALLSALAIQLPSLLRGLDPIPCSSLSHLDRPLLAHCLAQIRHPGRGSGDHDLLVRRLHRRCRVHQR